MAENSSLCDEERNAAAEHQTVAKPSTFRTKFSQVKYLQFLLYLLSVFKVFGPIPASYLSRGLSGFHLPALWYLMEYFVYVFFHPLDL
jgi:hypothetical protein